MANTDKETENPETAVEHDATVETGGASPGDAAAESAATDAEEAAEQPDAPGELGDVPSEQQAIADILAQGRAKGDEYQEVWEAWRDAELELYLARLQIRTEAELPDQDRVHTAMVRLEEMQEKTVASFVGAVRHYEDVLRIQPDHPDARLELANLYWSRLVAAENRGDNVDVMYFRALVEAYNDGSFDDALAGDGSLELQTEPSDAAVTLQRYASESGVMVLGEREELGQTPVERSPIAMGSYLLEVNAEGYAPTRVPVLMDRQARPKLTVKLRTDEEIGHGFIYVPGGPFVTGGDPANQAVGPRRGEVTGDYAISRYPVTAAQYLEFINARAKEAPRPASFHVPRRRRDDLLWPTDEDGVYHLPEEDIDGETWTLLRPVTHVSWDDAIAYCKWLSRRTGLPLRLPTSAELEKAGRGVDGRIFPWGTRFSSMYCKMAESRAERSQPEPVGAFGMDESPYGVCDIAGGVAEWCDGWYDQARGLRPLRGMGFAGTDFECRLTYERGHRPFTVLPYGGFRVAHSFE